MKQDLLIYNTTQELVEAVAQRVLGLYLELSKKNVQPAPEAEEPISIDEACSLLKISRVTLNNWRRQGLVTVHGMGRRKYLYKSEVLASLNQPKGYGGRGNRGLSRSGTSNGKAA